MNRVNLKKNIAVVLLFFFVGLSYGQNHDKEDRSQLYDTIMKMDSLLFTAFNERDMDAFKAFLSKDLEFYHDKGGVTNYAETIKNTKQLFEKNNGLSRMPIKDGMEVYPINQYGAVQIGAHRFCHQENGTDDCGEFKFVHVWKKENGSWIITRIISYDH